VCDCGPFRHFSFENQIAERPERIPIVARRSRHAFRETTIIPFPTAIKVAQKGNLCPLHCNQQFSLKFLAVSLSHIPLRCVTVSPGTVILRFRVGSRWSERYLSMPSVPMARERFAFSTGAFRQPCRLQRSLLSLYENATFALISVAISGPEPQNQHDSAHVPVRGRGAACPQWTDVCKLIHGLALLNSDILNSWIGARRWTGRKANQCSGGCI
jgi:hypothetical protein